MVSVISVVLAASFGLMCYLAAAFVAAGLPVEIRHTVGTFYGKKAAKCLKQFTFVRRVLSGYDVLPIEVDDEQKLLKVTLTSNWTSDDNEYPFRDPANRIKRLFGKPVALAFEQVPAAVDAELAELGHWVREKHVNESVWAGDLSDPDSVTVNPWVEMSDGLRLVDPLDAYALVINGVDAENIKTAEKMTKKRFEKYGGGVSPVQLVSGVLGFFAGIGGMMAMKFFNQKILDGSASAPDPTVPISMAADLVVMLL